MTILFFDKASYCKKRRKVTTQFDKSLYKNSRLELSGTLIRELLKTHKKIPKYIIKPFCHEAGGHCWPTRARCCPASASAR